MLMKYEFLEDMKDYLRSMPEEDEKALPLPTTKIMEDESLMESLWVVFQKDIEDCDCDSDFAFADAIKEVFGVTLSSIKL